LALKRELIRQNREAGSPLTLQEVEAFHAFLTEPKAEIRQTPSIEVGLYDSPGAATARTNPLGSRIPLILVHGSGSDILSDGEYGRELNDLERWIDYVRAFNADPEFSSRYKVYRFVYDSQLGIEQNGANLVTVLDTLTSYPGWETENLDGKNFVILAHSMGGLVSRAAMNMQFSVGVDAGHYFGDHVINLVTLGTPHRGSPLAIPAWVYDSVKRGSMMTELEFHYSYELHYGFDPTEGEFDLAWDNYDDGVPQTDITTYQHLLIPVLKKVGGGRDQHEESVFTPYPAVLNAADAFTGKLIAYCAQNPPQGDVDTLLDLMFYYTLGLLNEHHLLGFTSNKLAGLIAGDIGEGNLKPYGDNDGLVPFASAVFDGETVAQVYTLANSDHLSLLDKSQVITTVKTKLISIAMP
jgi:pimeloyl-ACP methyl ester carboxylesterase